MSNENLTTESLLKAFPKACEIRQCMNPECLKCFIPEDKFHPYQRYCGCSACNRSRGRQRQWKHEHKELHEKREEAQAAHGNPDASPVRETVRLNSRLLWLLAGLLSKCLGTRGLGELTAAVRELASCGSSLCGRNGASAILTSLMFADT